MVKTMKHLIFIHLFLFIPQRKNLFLLSNLLLILSFTGCKSAIKEEGLTKIQKTKPLMTQNTTSHGELYPGYRNGLYNWYDKKQKRIEGENNRIFGKYEGEIRKGLISYEHGIPNGQGTFIWSDGSRYVGEWKDGIEHGQGELTLPNGEKYIGEFNNRKFHGQGEFIFSDGTKYTGEWKDGL